MKPRVVYLVAFLILLIAAVAILATSCAMEEPTGTSKPIEGVDGATSVTLIGSKPGLDVYRIYDTYTGYRHYCYVAISSSGDITLECP